MMVVVVVFMSALMVECSHAFVLVSTEKACCYLVVYIPHPPLQSALVGWLVGGLVGLSRIEWFPERVSQPWLSVWEGERCQ